MRCVWYHSNEWYVNVKVNQGVPHRHLDTLGRRIGPLARLLNGRRDEGVAPFFGYA